MLPPELLSLQLHRPRTGIFTVSSDKEEWGRTPARGEGSFEVTRTEAVHGFVDDNQQLGLHATEIGVTGAQFCLVQSSTKPAPLSPRVPGWEPLRSLKFNPHLKTAWWGPVVTLGRRETRGTAKAAVTNSGMFCLAGLVV